MNPQAITALNVKLDWGERNISVGRLALQKHKIYFEYDAAFLETGLNISPFKLPLKPGVTQFDPALFEGLPGVFNDSLPDGWGRLLLDRYMRQQQILPGEMSALDRLAHVGKYGVGALVYEPDYGEDSLEEKVDLDRLAADVNHILEGQADEVLASLLACNGSSAGARPKAMIGVNKTKTQLVYGAGILSADYQPWMVKFPNMQDGDDAGAVEYVYSIMAKEAGVLMEETYLFPAKSSSGYFATKRFDRVGRKRVHMHSACGLLHSDFRVPALDYKDLLALTATLTRDMREVEQMYRVAVFNVLAHNRDDHSKNFSFLMNEEGQWRLAPGYDLTFSAGPRGQQSTMVLGEGENLDIDLLVRLGEEASLGIIRIQEVIEQTTAALSGWKKLAKQFHLKTSTINHIASCHP